MGLKLPSRYEDIDTAYRGRLHANKELLSLISLAQKSMQINGGIRFLPIYGKSGAGKSCAAREISTHLPGTKVFALSKIEIESRECLLKRIENEKLISDEKLLIAVIDQFEETVAGKEYLPTQFVEHLSILDRTELRTCPMIFIWLSTSLEFCKKLVAATSRNQRILLKDDFSISGPEKKFWVSIIEETFSFHNAEQALADYEVIETDIQKVVSLSSTIGEAIEKVGDLLGRSIDDLQNLSEYQVILMWPVADSTRNQRVLQFAKPREGYKLNWDIWYNELNEEDKRQLPLKELNRARLYFDVRIIPVRVADLYKMCTDLYDEKYIIFATYLERFKKTHFFHVVSDNWETYDYNPVRERESKRSEEAQKWYETVTDKPTLIGRRIASALTQCGMMARHERTLKSEYGSVRADVYTTRNESSKPRVIIELKLFSSENTMPSSIKDAIKTTLKRHAQFAGFLQRQ
ncbi:MAG: hypothetical protein KIC73_07080 [Clostridiales bacterium]|nr:hypothetical protein [Clostridiales bacterium]